MITANQGIVKFSAIDDFNVAQHIPLCLTAKPCAGCKIDVDRIRGIFTLIKHRIPDVWAALKHIRPGPAGQPVISAPANQCIVPVSTKQGTDAIIANQRVIAIHAIQRTVCRGFI